MLPPQQRLAPSASIKDTIRRGRRARRGSLVVHVLLNSAAGEPADNCSSARAAFAVGRSVGNSVERHRITRRLRAVTAPLLESLPPGTQVVIRAMPEARAASSAQLAADLRAALAKTIPHWTPDSSGAHESGACGHDPAPGTVEPEAEFREPRTGWRRVLWFIGWPIRALLLALIWVYRNTISPILPPTCRYYPSCSAYAFGSLQRHGAAKGFVLASWRLLRCNPFSPGGLDPVPPRGRWRPDIEPDGTPRVTPAQAA